MLALLTTLAFGSSPELSGIYQVDQTPTELEELHGKAVETAMHSLPWAIRALARRPVKRLISNCAQTAVDLQSTQLTVKCDDEPERVIDLPAKSVTMSDPDGDPMVVTVDIEPTHLTITYGGHEGGVTTRYFPDGEQLLVHKTLFSERLEAPVSWEVRYRRVP